MSPLILSNLLLGRLRVAARTKVYSVCVLVALCFCAAGCGSAVGGGGSGGGGGTTIAAGAACNTATSLENCSGLDRMTCEATGAGTAGKWAKLTTCVQGQELCKTADNPNDAAPNPIRKVSSCVPATTTVGDAKSGDGGAGDSGAGDAAMKDVAAIDTGGTDLGGLDVPNRGQSNAPGAPCNIKKDLEGCFGLYRMICYGSGSGTAGLWTVIASCPAGFLCKISDNPAEPAPKINHKLSLCENASGEAVCGNGKCEAGESNANCPADCPKVVSGFKYGIIYDKYAEPDCKMTASPGADIDAIGLYRNGALIGVIKPGTANYKGEKTSCVDNAHADPSSAEGPSDVYDTNKGYVGLNGGSLEFQIGGCSVSSTDITLCDGAGPSVTILPGDEFDVYEVGQEYKEKKWITEACKCISEDYEVWVRLEKGVDAGAVLVGNGKGLTTGMKVPMK